MTDFQTVNVSNATRDRINRIQMGRRSIYRLSGSGLSGADARSHHIPPIEILRAPDGSLNNTPAARALLILDQNVGGAYRLNGSNNLQILPTTGNSSLASSDLSIHPNLTNHPEYGAIYEARLNAAIQADPVLRDLFISNPTAFDNALRTGQLTPEQRAALTRAVDDVNWSMRTGMSADVRKG
ncbi:MAG: hypothetical protein KF779_07015 [Hyphomonadaceae bacterium]|nr:hypothetical protein [Hyphomonadaceae bacterium]